MSEDPANDNKKAAVAMSVTLSGQLMTAALAVMALNAGFVSYVLANRIPEYLYYISSSIAFIVFAGSLYFGGKGIIQARDKGFASDWNLSAGKSKFNLQAILCLAGLLLVSVSPFFSGKPKANDMLTEIMRIGENIASLRQEVQDQRKTGEIVSKELNSIQVFDGAVSEKLLRIQDQLISLNTRVSRTEQVKESKRR